MKTIMRLFRKIMLRKAMEYCEFRQIRLGIKTDRYHKEIMEKIIKGEDKLKIEKLKFRREKLWREKSELLELEYKFRSKLRRA